MIGGAGIIVHGGYLSAAHTVPRGRPAHVHETQDETQHPQHDQEPARHGEAVVHVALSPRTVGI